MNEIKEIWDTGLTTPFDLRGSQLDEFVRRTGSTKVTGLRWRHDGASHEIEGLSRVLLSHRCVVSKREKEDGRRTSLVVTNADGTVRFIFEPPPVVDGYLVATGEIELPESGRDEFGFELGVVAGYLDTRPSSIPSAAVLFDLDWTTGEVRGWRFKPWRT